MNFRNLVILFSLLISSISLNAHEGHDSATAKSLYGGVVKKTKNTYVEVLQDEKIEIYVSDHEYKSLIGSSKLSLKATADVKGKKMPLKLELNKNNYIVVTDLSKEKHFKLIIELKVNEKEETATFPLEKK